MWQDIDLIKVVKKHGKSLDETELVRGMVIDKELQAHKCPKSLKAQKSYC